MKRAGIITLWGITAVITLVGMAAIGLRIYRGLGITNLNYIVPWGLWVAFYIYFIGLSAGSFLLSTMIFVFGVKRFEPIGRIALFSALIALNAGLMFVLLDLGHMERFWTVFFYRNLFSVLSIEIHFYLLYIAIICSELWLLMRRDLIRIGGGSGMRATLCRWLSFGSTDLSESSAARDMRIVKILGLIGLPTAIGVHGGTGALFAVVKARPMWYGPLFPIIFIVSALASGAALLTFIVAFFGRMPKSERTELTQTLGKLTAGILAFDLLLIWSEFSIGFYGAIPEDLEALRLIVFGPFWWVFWLQQLLFGAIAPMILILWPTTGRNPYWVGLAGLMVVIGIFGVRLNIVIPALSMPIVPGLVEAYSVTPAPGKAAFTIAPEMIVWLQRGAILMALMTIVVFSLVGWHTTRRTQTSSQRRMTHWMAQIAAGAGVAAIGLLVFVWFGSNPVLLSTASANYLADSFSGLSGLLQLSPVKSLYFPSPNEWLTSLGVIGLTVILFAIGWQMLPLETESH